MEEKKISFVFVGNQWRLYLKKLEWKQESIPMVHVRSITPLQGNNVLLFPMMESDTCDLYKEQHSTTNAIICAPTPDMMVPFSCKRRFWHFAKTHKLTDLLPRHFECKEEIVQDKDHEMIYIAKAPTGVAGRGHRILKPTELQLDCIFTKFIVQEVIQGPFEYVAHIVANKGSIVHCLVYEYCFDTEVFIRGGVTETTVIKKVAFTKEDLDCFTRFLTPISYTGQCNIGYKRNKDGQMKVLEINPRFGGSLMLKKNVADMEVFLTHLISVFFL